MTLSTKFFEGLAVASAKGRGMGSLHHVVLPWPYDTLSEAEVRSLAQRAFDLTVSGLLLPNRGVMEVR